MERLGRPRHGREGRRLSELNPAALLSVSQRAVSTSLDMTNKTSNRHFRRATEVIAPAAIEKRVVPRSTSGSWTTANYLVAEYRKSGKGKRHNMNTITLKPF